MFGKRHHNEFSKKRITSLVIAILLFNTMILSFYQCISQNSHTQMNKDVKFKATDFHIKAAELSAQVPANKHRFWLAQSELTHREIDIPVDKIIVKKENGTVGPSETFYDPRLTLSVYLDELRRAGDTQNLPTFPFHWVDWASVNMADPPFAKDDSKKISCSRLQNRIKGKPEYCNFCKDRDTLSDEELERLGFRNRQELPKALIFDHCPHKNHCFNDVRVFMAKSYTMAHLPKPFKVIILNDVQEGGTFEFMVNRSIGSDQRLLFSGMIERFVESNMETTSQELLEKGGVLHVDTQKTFKHLVDSVRPRHLKEDDDVMGMYATVHGKHRGSTKEIRLHESHFHYPKYRVQSYIIDYEKNKNRNVMEQAFLEGLLESARFDGTSEPRYFKMARLNTKESQNVIKDRGWHYDWRFFNDALFLEKQGWFKEERIERTNIILERLLRNWNRFAEEKGIVSWIMHGPLLSWYWNGLMFPYDNDIDIQMPISELVRLAQHYNQTLVVENPAEGYGRYLIDVGTFIHNRDRSETGNHIDARFVDVDSGVYIDITGLAKSNFEIPEEYNERSLFCQGPGDANAEVYNDRRKHFYTLDQIQPLRYTKMSGVPLFVPKQIEKRLQWEYPRGLQDYEFRKWYFVAKLQLWIPKHKLKRLYHPQQYQNEHDVFDVSKMEALVKEMSDEKALQLLKDNAILTEYYLTSELAKWHSIEKSLLFTADGKDNPSALDNPETRKLYIDLVAKVRFSRPLRKCLFEYETYDRLDYH